MILLFNRCTGTQFVYLLSTSVGGASVRKLYNRSKS